MPTTTCASRSREAALALGVGAQVPVMVLVVMVLVAAVEEDILSCSVLVLVVVDALQVGLRRLGGRVGWGEHGGRGEAGYIPVGGGAISVDFGVELRARRHGPTDDTDVEPCERLCGRAEA